MSGDSPLTNSFLMTTGTVFNVISVDVLRSAQKEPEKYRNLIVRVAGYSDYFNNLSKTLQDEIISRTEHQLC